MAEQPKPTTIPDHPHLGSPTNCFSCGADPEGMSITGRDTETSLVTTIHICRPCAWVSISSSPETRAEYGRLLKEYLGYNPLDAPTS
jgi:hypothetical protein